MTFRHQTIPMCFFCAALRQGQESSCGVCARPLSTSPIKTCAITKPYLAQLVLLPFHLSQSAGTFTLNVPFPHRPLKSLSPTHLFFSGSDIFRISTHLWTDCIPKAVAETLNKPWEGGRGGNTVSRLVRTSPN